MKAKWLIEHFDDRNSTLQLIDEVQRQGFECRSIKYLPYMSGSINVYDRQDCVITQTSIDMALQIQRDKPMWIPGPWLTSFKYKCSEYYSYLGKYLFNDKYVMMPRSEVLRNINNLYEWLGVGDAIFMRPDSGLKSFTGKVFTRSNFETDWSWVEEYTNPTSLVVISTPKNLGFEWRFIVSDKKVITGSQYCINGEHSCSPIFSEEAQALAQEIAEIYNPDQVFVIDICQGADHKLYLLEIGSFSCAGLYACDMEKIVEHVSTVALKEWETYNTLNCDFVPHK